MDDEGHQRSSLGRGEQEWHLVGRTFSNLRITAAARIARLTAGDAVALRHTEAYSSRGLTRDDDSMHYL